MTKKSLKRRSFGKIVNSPRRCSPLRKRRSGLAGDLLPPLSSLPLMSSSSSADAAAAASSSIRVSIRVRPMNSREESMECRNIIDVVDDKLLIFDPKTEDDAFFFHGKRQNRRDLNKKVNRDHKFAFDSIFDTDSTNESVFEGSTKGLVDTLFKGYNCSVFVYGATGAGKTFTMLGSDDNPGITFRTVSALYDRIEELKDELSCEVAVSYLEIYNETVVDLINPGGLVLNIREDGKNGVTIPGLTRHKPSNPQELLKLLRYGNSNRSQHPTDANAESSRSHAIFQVFLRQQDKNAGLSADVKVAKLSMIDLAGSERGTATSSHGSKRLREGANINKSLLALGNCINALSDGSKHIPYRNSKLTRLLKDSIGGNCQTVMISNVSPSSLTYEDTYNTLKYADRAKRIKIKLKKNVVSVDFHVAQYAKIVEDLKKEIFELKEKLRLSEKLEDENEALCNQISFYTTGNDENDGDRAPLPSPSQDVKALMDQIKELEKRQLDYDELQPRIKQSEGQDQELESVISQQKIVMSKYYDAVSRLKLIELKLVHHERTLQRIASIAALVGESFGNHSGKKVRRAIEKLRTKKAQCVAEKNTLHEAMTEVPKKLATRFTNLDPNAQKMATSELESAKARLLYQHALKCSKLLADEHRKADTLLAESIPRVLSYYLRLKGYNHTTATIDTQFQEFVAQACGQKVVWDDKLTTNNLEKEGDLLGSVYANTFDLEMSFGVDTTPATSSIVDKEDEDKDIEIDEVLRPPTPTLNYLSSPKKVVPDEPTKELASPVLENPEESQTNDEVEESLNTTHFLEESDQDSQSPLDSTLVIESSPILTCNLNLTHVVEDPVINESSSPSRIPIKTFAESVSLTTIPSSSSHLESPKPTIAVQPFNKKTAAQPVSRTPPASRFLSSSSSSTGERRRFMSSISASRLLGVTDVNVGASLSRNAVGRNYMASTTAHTNKVAKMRPNSTQSKENIPGNLTRSMSHRIMPKIRRQMSSVPFKPSTNPPQ